MKPAALVIALPGNEALALAIAARCGGEVGTLQLHRFPDQELRVRIEAAVAGREVVLACALDHPDDKMAGLHFTARTLRELGATRILLAAPYLAYMRQDRAFQSGEGTQARHYAQWLSSLIDGLVTVDPHLHRIHSLSEIYEVPCTVVPAAPAIAAWIAQHVGQPLLVGPDAESAQWLEAIAQSLGCPRFNLQKTRKDDRIVQLRADNLPPPEHRQAVIVDDIVSSATTMSEAVRLLRRQGYEAPICIAVHALFDAGAEQALRSAGAGRVLSCNSIRHASNAIDLHGAIAAAVAEMLAVPQPDVPAPALELACPLCARTVRVDSAQCRDGEGLVCPHCAARCVLQREWPGHSGESRWELVEAGDEEEP